MIFNPSVGYAYIHLIYHVEKQMNKGENFLKVNFIF